MGKITFKELAEMLPYFSVENRQEKTIGEIREEFRKFIEESGFDVVEENWDADAYVSDYIDEMHPEWNTENFEWSRINYQPIEFLCMDEYNGDVCFADVNIDFYGDFEKGIGVFNVTD